MLSVDTLWNTFRLRMASINASRSLMGVMSALDFPPKMIEFNAFYLIVLADQPLGKQADSAAVPVYVTTAQFTWVNEGTDVGTEEDSEGRNRGDRYRTNRKMIKELVQALYPRFAQEIELPDENTLANAADFVITTLNQPVVWTYPTFQSREDRDSGLIYATATIRITSFVEMIAA